MNPTTAPGTIVRKRLKPYGNERTNTATTVAGTDHGFLGQPEDTTGLNYLNNRYHHPKLATFTSVDPLILQTGQPYSYANNNPVTLSDPSGLCAPDVGNGRQSCVDKAIVVPTGSSGPGTNGTTATKRKADPAPAGPPAAGSGGPGTSGAVSNTEMFFSCVFTPGCPASYMASLFQFLPPELRGLIFGAFDVAQKGDGADGNWSSQDIEAAAAGPDPVLAAIATKFLTDKNSWEDLDSEPSRWRVVGQWAVMGVSILAAASCAASVVCGVLVGAAFGAAGYLVANAGTEDFSMTGLISTTLVGGVAGGAGAKALQFGRMTTSAWTDAGFWLQGPISSKLQYAPRAGRALVDVYSYGVVSASLWTASNAVGPACLVTGQSLC